MNLFPRCQLPAVWETPLGLQWYWPNCRLPRPLSPPAKSGAFRASCRPLAAQIPRQTRWFLPASPPCLNPPEDVGPLVALPWLRSQTVHFCLRQLPLLSSIGTLQFFLSLLFGEAAVLNFSPISEVGIPRTHPFANTETVKRQNSFVCQICCMFTVS